MKDLMRKLAARLQRLSPLAITVVGVLSVLALGIADHYCPDPLSFLPFYMLVVVFVGWGAGKWQAVIVAGLAITVMAIVQWAVHSGITAPGWVVDCNRFMRFLIFSMAGWLTAEVTGLTRHLSQRVEERTAQWKAEVEHHKATSTRLAEALDRFEQVINNITEVFWLTDVSKGQVVYVSPGYERVWGRNCEELYRDPRSWLAGLHPEDREAVGRRSRTEQAAGGYDVQYRILRPDGALRWIRDRAFPVCDQEGQVYRLAGIAEDITQQKQAEWALARQEKLYHTILATAMDGFFALDFGTDSGGAIIEVNDAYCHLIGYRREELLQMRIADLEAAETPEEVARHQAAIMAAGADRFETRHRRKDGREIQVEISVSRLADSHAQVFGFVRDITARKRAEVALREAHDKLEVRVRERTIELQMVNAALRGSEARLRLALDASNAGIWSWDVASNNSTWDTRSYELYGFQPQQPVSLEAWIERVHPEDRQNLLGRVRRIVESGENDSWNEEFRIMHPVKGERWMAGLGRVERDQAGRAVRLAGINLDITERKRAEQAQRVQLAQIEAIYQSAPVGLCVLDTNFRYLRINERLAAMNGLPVEEHLGRTVRDAVPDMADAIETLCRQAIATGQPVLNVEVEGITPSQPGLIRSGMTHWVPLKEPDGRVIGINILVEDITERKAMDRALKESEQKYRRLHESMRDAFASVDLNGRITEFNPAFRALLGYEPNELRDLTYVDLTPGQWHATEAQILAEQVLPRGYSDVYEKEYRRKDGTIFPVELRTYLLRDAQGQPAAMWAIVRDITQRKLAEQTLREARAKLEVRVKERTAELQASNAALAEGEDRYRSLVNNLNVGVYRNTTGPAGRFLQVNPALARMHGYDSVEEFSKVRVVDLYQEPAHRKVLLAELLRQGSVVNYELRLKKKDGTAIYGSINATVHRRPNGEADWIDGTLEDITERKQAEQDLAEALELNRTLVSASPVGIAVYKDSGRCVIANEALSRIAGGTIEQLLQQDFRRLQSWRTDGLLAKAETALETGQPQDLDTHSRTTFGRELVVSAKFSAFKSQGDTHLLLLLNDVTEAARAAEALRASEDRYRALAESSPDAIFILDREIKVQYVNSTAAELWRRRPEELIGLPQRDLFPPEVARYHSQVVAEVFETGQPVRRDEPLAFPTGEQWIDIRLVPLYGEQRTVISVMGVCRDISERKHAERQLAETLDLNQKMIAASTLGITAYRASGECVFANEALAQTLGGSVGEVLQGNFQRLKSWQESGLLQLAEETLGQGQARRGEFYTTTRFGKSVWLACHMAPFVSNGHPHLLLMALDITEGRRAELLLRVQRDLGVRLSLTGDLNVALSELIDIATRIEAVDCGGILLLEPPTGDLRLAAHRGVPAEFAAAASHIAADTPQARLIRAGKPVYMHYSHLPIARSPVQEREGLRASALIPLSHEGAILGSLNLASHRFDEIPPQTRLVIEAIAAQAAGAIARIRAEEARRQSEARLRAIVTSAPVLLFAVDQDGIIRFEDGQGLKALGATRGANVGRPVKEVYAHAPAILENSRRALGGEEIEAIVQVGPVTFQSWYSPTRDLEGKPTGYIGVATNITERHRLERQILDISDREQARIGQDIHDGLCQHLVSLAFDANALERALSTANRPEANTARRIADYLDQAISESRQLSRGLFPVRLETAGLSSALEELANSTSARFHIQCRFDRKGPPLVKHASLATHFYRIAQEAVANAVKHGRARTVRIRLHNQTKQIELRVEDDGAGLSPAKRKKATGLGLHIMDYRARAIGGTLHIGPRPRGGTLVSCCVPRPKS